MNSYQEEVCKNISEELDYVRELEEQITFLNLCQNNHKIDLYGPLSFLQIEIHVSLTSSPRLAVAGKLRLRIVLDEHRAQVA